MLFGFKNKKINGPIIALWITFLFSLFLFFDSKLGAFDSIKLCFNYLSPAVIAFASFTVFDKTKFRISYRFFLTCILIYFFVGFIQTYFIPDFLAFLLNGNARGNMAGGRGVVSLCSEPAFYGSMCLFFMAIALINFNKKENYILIPILLFQLFALSKTATGIGLLIIAFVIFSIVQLFKLKFKPFIILGSMALVSSIAFNHVINSYEDSRVVTVANQFVKNPMLIAQVDASASVRFTGSLAPYLNFKHNHFLPMGFGRYQEFLIQLYHEGQYLALLTRRTIMEKDRLGGSINMILFQLGFLDLLFPFAIYRSFKGLMHQPAAVFAFILFVVLLFSQIQLMNAIIGFTIGLALIKSKDIHTKEEAIV